VREAHAIQPLVPALQSWWMKVHVPANFVGYGTFAIAAMVAFAAAGLFAHTLFLVWRAVDGGASANGFLCQLQADALQVPVARAAQLETTGLGAAFAAGLATGVWSGTAELAALWRAERRFEPQRPAAWATERMQAWAHAVVQATA
jgi:glycerol kinase